jgi:hypothetical protein
VGAGADADARTLPSPVGVGSAGAGEGGGEGFGDGFGEGVAEGFGFGAAGGLGCGATGVFVSVLEAGDGFGALAGGVVAWPGDGGVDRAGTGRDASPAVEVGVAPLEAVPMGWPVPAEGSGFARPPLFVAGRASCDPPPGGLGEAGAGAIVLGALRGVCGAPAATCDVCDVLPDGWASK